MVFKENRKRDRVSNTVGGFKKLGGGFFEKIQSLKNNEICRCMVNNFFLKKCDNSDMLERGGVESSVEKRGLKRFEEGGAVSCLNLIRVTMLAP